MYRRSVRRTSRRPYRRLYRRRTYSRKRTGRRNGSVWAKTNSGTIASTPYRGRRVSKTVWRKRQLRASDDAEHWRSALTVSGINATTATIGTALVAFVAWMPNQFWTPTGGLQNELTDKSFAGDLFVRGGRTSITFSNPNTGTIRIRLWKVRTTTNGSLGGSLPVSTVSSAWDPSLVEDFQRFYRFYEPTEFLLKSTEVYSRNAYIRAGKLDQSMFAGSNQRDFWVYSYSNVDVATAKNLIVEVTTSLSFTGDATVI